MIKIYGKKDCVWCTKAKDECWKLGITYEYKDVYEDLTVSEFKELFEHKAVGARTFPIVIVNDNYIGGYSELKRYLAPRAIEKEIESGY